MLAHCGVLAGLGVAMGAQAEGRRLKVHLELTQEDALEADAAEPDRVLAESPTGDRSQSDPAPPEDMAAAALASADEEADEAARSALAALLATPTSEVEPGQDADAAESAFTLVRDLGPLIAITHPRLDSERGESIPTVPTPAAAITALPGSNPPPAYPPLARKRGWSGTVVLVVEVGNAGQVLAVRLARSSGHAILDATAREAVVAWRFTGGPGSTELTIRFVLEKAS